MTKIQEDFAELIKKAGITLEDIKKTAKLAVFYVKS